MRAGRVSVKYHWPVASECRAWVPRGQTGVMAGGDWPQETTGLGMVFLREGSVCCPGHLGVAAGLPELMIHNQKNLSANRVWVWNR